MTSLPEAFHLSLVTSLILELHLLTSLLETLPSMSLLAQFTLTLLLTTVLVMLPSMPTFNVANGYIIFFVNVVTGGNAISVDELTDGNSISFDGVASISSNSYRVPLIKGVITNYVVLF